NREIEASSLSSVNTGTLLTFRWNVNDTKTRPEARRFRWKVLTGSASSAMLEGTNNWNYSGASNQVRCPVSERGKFTFGVEHVDRDLRYAEPAFAVINAVVPWHANAWITVPGGAAVVGLLGWAFLARSLYQRKRSEAERLRERLLEEEHKARAALE